MLKMKLCDFITVLLSIWYLYPFLYMLNKRCECLQMFKWLFSFTKNVFMRIHRNNGSFESTFLSRRLLWIEIKKSTKNPSYSLVETKYSAFLAGVFMRPFIYPASFQFFFRKVKITNFEKAWTNIGVSSFLKTSCQFVLPFSRCSVSE